jgi:hypothetical protein
MSNLLNEKQVAVQYNIAPGTLRRQRWAGIGLPYRVIGRAIQNVAALLDMTLQKSKNIFRRIGSYDRP